MRFSALLADLRLMCPGMPEPWQYRFLTRSLQSFLGESEVWKEWTTEAWDFTAASLGRYAVPNSRYNPVGPVDAFPYVRTNRVHEVRWVPTGELLKKVTQNELDRCWPMWETDRGKTATYWTPTWAAYAGSTVPGVQLTPFPATIADDTPAALRFYVSHTITEIETPEQVYALEDALVASGTADWLFRRYRETILAGALARALMAPNVDWSNPSFAATYAAAFQMGVDKARSETQAGQTTSHATVTYGGY